MLDPATRIAALVVFVSLPAATLVILALILRGTIFVFNRTRVKSTPVAIPAIGRAIAITLISVFVNGIFLIGYGMATKVFPGTFESPVIALCSLACGIYVMARILVDILPSSFAFASAAMFTATMAQWVFLSIAGYLMSIFFFLWKQP